MTLTFETMPVSTNNLYRNVPGRGRVLTTKGKECKEAIGWEARSQWRQKPLEGSVAIELTIFYPDRRRRDFDNLKAVYDALTGIVWKDDSQIDDAHIIKVYPDPNPRMELRVWSLT